MTSFDYLIVETFAAWFAALVLGYEFACIAAGIAGLFDRIRDDDAE